MEAKELFQKFTSLRRDYREKQLNAMKPKPEWKNYSEQYIRELIKKEVGKLAELQLEEAGNFQKSVERYYRDTVNKINQVRYPLISQTDTDKLILLELIRQRAFNFLSLTNDNSRIETELRTAMNTDENYFSSLIDLIKAKKPTELSENEIEFYKRVEKLERDFEQIKDIAALKKQRDSFSELVTEANRYIQALRDGKIDYYTKSEVESLKQEEVNNNYDFITQSMSYWK